MNHLSSDGLGSQKISIGESFDHKLSSAIPRSGSMFKEGIILLLLSFHFCNDYMEKKQTRDCPHVQASDWSIT